MSTHPTHRSLTSNQQKQEASVVGLKYARRQLNNIVFANPRHSYVEVVPMECIRTDQDE